MMSKIMCLTCWTSNPPQVVLPDGQVITLTRPSTVGGLLERCRSKHGYYVCEASTPGMNSPLFPQVSHNPLFDAAPGSGSTSASGSASPLQGGALLSPDTKLQRGHLYFVLPLPELSPRSLERFRSGAYAPNSLSSLLRRSAAAAASREEDLATAAAAANAAASGKECCDGSSRICHHHAQQQQQGGSAALKSAIARRSSARISPDLGASLQQQQQPAGGRAAPVTHKDAVYRSLASGARSAGVCTPTTSGDVRAAPVVASSVVEPVMQSWHDRPPNPPPRFSMRRRRSFRTYAGTWKPELPIISEDRTLGSCLGQSATSDTDDDESASILVGSTTSAACTPSR